MALNLDIEIRAKDETGAAFDSAKQKTEGFGASMKRVGEIAGGFFAANVADKALGAVVDFAGGAIDAAKESAAVNAQLEAVLKSTGQAAGVTADMARDLAGALEKTSLFEDEAVLAGENLLLTFTNIGKDVFPTATQAIVDMSQSLGQDMKSSAIQVGKALNDPIAGITALTRVGVSFTEEQKEQIKAMVEAGDVAGAQKLILAELNKEFGGSAKAASDAAGASERLKDRQNELSEQIGAKLLPVQLAISEAKLKFVDILVTKVIPTIESLYQKYWPALAQAIDAIRPVVEFAVNFVIAKIEGFIQFFEGIVEVVSGVVQLVSDIFHGRWREAWEDLQKIAEGVVDMIIGYLKTAFGNLPEILWDAGRAAIQGLVNGLLSIDIGSVVSGIASKVKDGVTGVLGIKSPSTVMAEYGRNIVQGLVLGMRSQEGTLGGGTSRLVDRLVPPPANTGAGGSGLSVNINGNVIVNNTRNQMDATQTIKNLAYMLAVESRSRGLMVLT